MWLHGVSARVAAEVRVLLSEHEPVMAEVDRRLALHQLLQFLARDIAGRSVTEEECERVLSKGEGAFEQLLQRYEREHLRAHDRSLYTPLTPKDDNT